MSEGKSLGPGESRVIVYAGIPDQAVEVVGRALKASRGELAKAGVRVIHHEDLDPLLSDPDLDEAVRRTRRLIENRYDGTLPSNLILVSGRFLGATPLGAADITDLRPNAGARLNAILEGLGISSAEVFLHTLRPDNLVTEIQIAHVRAGGTQSYSEMGLDGDGKSLSQLRVAESLLDAPVVQKVWIRPFEFVEAGHRALIEDMFTTLGLDVDTRTPEGSKPPEVWSTRAIQIALDVNQHLETEADRTLVHDFVTSLVPAEPGTGTRAGSRSAMTSIVDTYAAESTDLFARFMPDLDPSAYTMESATDEMIDGFAARHAPNVLAVRLEEAAAHVGSGADLDISDLYLHVGLQKTGTTMVQRNLTILRPQLHAAGVAYVDRADVMRLPNLRAWSAYVRSRKAKYEKFADELRAAVSNRYEAVLERTGSAPRAVLISNESLVGVHARKPSFEAPFRPRAERAIQDFIEILQPSRVVVLMHVRRQDRMIESQYMHSIHGGADFHFEDYAANVMSSPVLRYSNLADRIEAIDGVREIRIRPFELIGAGPDPFLQDLIEPLGVDLDLTQVPDSPTNQSYSERALRIALAVNPLLKKKKEAARMRHFLEELIPASTNPKPVLLEPEQRSEILDQYRADNERLFAQYMPQFPIDSYSTPEATLALPSLLSADYDSSNDDGSGK